MAKIILSETEGNLYYDKAHPSSTYNKVVDALVNHGYTRSGKATFDKGTQYHDYTHPSGSKVRLHHDLNGGYFNRAIHITPDNKETTKYVGSAFIKHLNKFHASK
jgi:hypothetical protein